MSKKKFVAEEFQLIVREAQYNELAHEAEKFQEERRKAAELRKALTPKACNASELLVGHSKEEEEAALFAELDREEAEAKKAAKAAEEKDDERETVKFPAPNITTR